MGKAQANFKLKPGPSLATSEKLKPKTWWCSNFYSIKDSIFWSLLKKSSLSLDQARAVNKESLENEVADVHRNIPWAQQAEKKSQLPGF